MGPVSATVILALILTVSIIYSVLNAGQMIYTLSLHYDKLTENEQAYGIGMTILSIIVFLFVAIGGSKSLQFFRTNCKSRISYDY